MFGWADCTISDQQVAAHAQMDNEVEIGKLNIEIFCAATDINDLLSLDLLFEFFGRRRGKCTVPAQVSVENLFADEGWFQLAYKGFDFRKFRHGLYFWTQPASLWRYGDTCWRTTGASSLSPY